MEVLGALCRRLVHVCLAQMVHSNSGAHIGECRENPTGLKELNELQLLGLAKSNVRCYSHVYCR